jgi:hypothetical protein
LDLLGTLVGRRLVVATDHFAEESLAPFRFRDLPPNHGKRFGIAPEKQTPVSPKRVKVVDFVPPFGERDAFVCFPFRVKSYQTRETKAHFPPQSCTFDANKFRLQAIHARRVHALRPFLLAGWLGVGLCALELGGDLLQNKNGAFKKHSQLRRRFRRCHKELLSPWSAQEIAARAPTAAGGPLAVSVSEDVPWSSRALSSAGDGAPKRVLPPMAASLFLAVSDMRRTLAGRMMAATAFR